MKLMMITGANGQIGSFLANAYYAEGYKLVLLFHKRNHRLTDLINKPGVTALEVDLQDYSAVQFAVHKLEHTPEILIHCAAVRSDDAQPLISTEPDVFHKVFDTNFYCAYNVLRCVLPIMQENCFGRVVMYGSDVTRGGLENGSSYAAAKAAIVNLVKSTAKEVAAQNVLINAISPAPVDTCLEEDYYGEYLIFRQRYFAKHLKSVPTGKLVSKEEIKKVTDLLISPIITSLTGEEIFLCGGLK